MHLIFQFKDIADLLYMSGHGPYVWASYLITVVGIIGLAVLPAMARKKFIRLQKSLLRHQAS